MRAGGGALAKVQPTAWTADVIASGQEGRVRVRVESFPCDCDVTGLSVKDVFCVFNALDFL